ERRADTRTQAWVDSMFLTMGKAYSNGTVHQYRYDAKGRLATTSSDDLFLPDSALVNHTYGYSRADQLILDQIFFAEKSGATIIRRFEYNRRGQRTRVVDSVLAIGIDTVYD